MWFDRSTELAAGGPEVFALMTSHPYQERKAAALGALDVACEITDHGRGAVTVVARRATPAGVVPELIKALVRPTLRITETEDWAEPDRAGHSGRFVVDVGGAPVSVRGGVRLEPSPQGCRLTFDGELTTSIPLFRAAIEEAAAGRILATIDTEFALLHELLAETAGDPPTAVAPQH